MSKNRYHFIESLSDRDIQELKDCNYIQLSDNISMGVMPQGLLVDSKNKAFWVVTQQDLRQANEITKMRDGQEIDNSTISEILE